MSGRLDVIGDVLRNRDLRRVELAYGAFNANEAAVWLAMLVYAYRNGGTTTASVVAIVQLVPAALFAPFAAVLADRHPPVRVLGAGYAAQGAAMAGTAVVILAGAPAAVAYACAAVAATAVTVTRPTQAALTPALARTPEELTATNVVSGWVENSSVLSATAATGALLDLTGPGVVFAVCAALGIAAAFLIVGVSGPAAAVAATEADAPLDEALAGFRALAEHSGPRLVVGLLGVELVVWGALDILCVVLALDVLAVGTGWVGYLNAAFAAGGVAGSSLALVLVGRRRLAPPIIGAMLIWGLVFVVIALAPSVAVAMLLLVVGGAGRAVFDVSSRTLLQRIAPADVLGRVFGVLEGIEMAALALGALFIPLLVAAGGPKAALIGVGALLPVAALLGGARLVAADAGAAVPIVEIALLRSMRLFGLLPAPAIEGVAHALEPVAATEGDVIVREGDTGDRFYVIAGGEVDVTHAGTHVARLGRGEGFGEIALLRDIPRTATVTAIGDVRLYSLEMEPFVTAVTGHAPVASAANVLVDERRSELAQHDVGAAGDRPGPIS